MFSSRNTIVLLVVVLVSISLTACAGGNPALVNNTNPTTTPNIVPTNEPAVQSTPAPQATAAHVPTVINVDDIAVIRATTRTVSEFLSELDENFNLYWYADISGAWGSREATAGYSIQGPALFWTDLFDNALTAGTTRIRTQGGWGVYHVAAGSSFTVPHNNGGGRWIRLSANLSGSIACLSDFAYVVGGETTNAVEAVTFMDEHTNASTSYTHNSVIVPANTVAVVWADWHGNPPSGFFPLTPTSTEGGYGVWVTVTDTNVFRFNMPEGGGGTTFLENCSF